MGRKDSTYLLGMIVMPIIFNIFTIQNLLKIISITEQFDLPVTNRFTALVFTGILFYFLIRYLATKDRILSIFKEFEKKTKTQKWIMNIMVVLYLVVTVFLYFYTSEITREMYHSGVL